jgi:hypothetical protein
MDDGHNHAPHGPGTSGCGGDDTSQASGAERIRRFRLAIPQTKLSNITEADRAAAIDPVLEATEISHVPIAKVPHGRPRAQRPSLCFSSNAIPSF